MRASPSCLAAVLFLALGSPAAGAPIEGFATLWVGVHRDAGGAADAVAEGAAGPCLTSAVRLLCPAVGPVVFRWAGAPGWELVGEATVGAGQEGTAWVLANELTRAPQRAALASPSLTAEQVLALYTRTGATLPPPASAGMLEDLVRLARHDDPTVRQGRPTLRAQR